MEKINNGLESEENKNNLENKPNDSENKPIDGEATKEDIQEDVTELDKLLADLDDSDEGMKEAIDDVEKSGNITPEVEKLLSEIRSKDSQIKEFSETVKSLQDKIKTLNIDKSDLTYKNAELEAFGGVTDPQLMIVVRNFSKAKEGDQIAKDKIKSIISDIRSGIYGTDIEKEKIDSNIDALTEVDKYVSKKNPNFKMKGENNTPVF